LRADTSLSIAYIGGRLISGKNIISLYDYCRAGHVDITSLPHAHCLARFDYAPPRFKTFGSTNGIKYRYPLDNGNYINLIINGSTFIGYLCDGSSHFIGTVRGDSIYLYDQGESTHFNYRISRCVVEYQNGRAAYEGGGLENKGGVKI